MKILRKIVMLSILAAVLILTLTASRCHNEFNSETLVADKNAVAEFIRTFNTSSYHFNNTWDYGIIVQKTWKDDKGGLGLHIGAITKTQLTIQTKEKTVTITSQSTLTDNQQARWDRLHVGYLIVFDPSAES